MRLMFVMLFILVACLTQMYMLVDASNNTCYPGMSCFPDNQELATFAKGLGGRLFFPYQKEYDIIAMMRNTFTTKFPYMVVYAKSTEDIQKGILFSRKHNLRLTIKSSGHDYQGRSTWDGSLQIYLGNMTGITVNINSSRSSFGEATIQSGAQWISVYKKIDKYNRIIVGGSGHTVAMGGYTQGGGHSPMSRMFGLAVDNLVEVEMVTANGTVVIANENETRYIHEDSSITTVPDTDLFWAIRGGGGGTWGVITNFTFKLHPAPSAFVNFACDFMFTLPNGTRVANQVFHKLFGFIQTKLPREWGGYIIVDAVNRKSDGSIGSISTYFNHYGGWDTDTRRVMDEIYHFQTEWQRNCIYVNNTSFFEHEKTAQYPPHYSMYRTNSLVGNLTDEFIDELIRDYTASSTVTYTTMILLGGKVTDVGENNTSVHPGIRHAALSVTLVHMHTTQGNDDYDIYYNNEGKQLDDGLRKFGYGIYRNEASSHSSVWRNDFWGTNYPRLERIKRQWDPDNIFTCVDCVGSDL